ncbi:MAG: hemolysin III family protein [Proteobacteria bacterium]|nr:hemolysin III family protein [Pseudomonadota bacterium]
MYSIFKDPFSGLTHMVGAAFGLIGLGYMIGKMSENTSFDMKLSFVIFGISIVFMYGSSAAYHLLHVSDQTRKALRRVDHTMIFFLIAGTYTPFCLGPLRETYGIPILIVIWSIALLGFFVKLFWLDAPRWLSTLLYLGMGWISVSAIVPLMNALSTEGLYNLVGGGVLYSIGAVIYAFKWPDPYPPHFGFHEIWHLFVLAGTTCHFISVLTFLN